MLKQACVKAKMLNKFRRTIIMNKTIIRGSTRVCHLKPESRIKKTRLKLAKLKLRSAQSICIMTVSSQNRQFLTPSPLRRHSLWTAP